MRKILLKRILQKISITLLWCYLLQSNAFANPVHSITTTTKSMYTSYLADELTGRVSELSGRPLVDAAVQIKGKPASLVLTDLNGRYLLNADKGDIIVFTVEGFVTQELVFNDQKELNVIMQEDTSVSTTFNILYTKQKKKTNIQSVEELRTEELTKTISTPINGVLQGRFAGLATNQANGGPGTDAVAISLRGQSPLILLDGVPQSFASINPEQIESITILKDALSTAMLGIRGSNGVVAITTKKGKEGPQRIELTALAGLQTPLDLPKFLNSYDYASLYNEALANDGKAPVYSQSDLDAYKNGSDPIGHPNVDWQNEVLKKNAPYQRYDLSISGGRKVARYYVNLDYLNQQGLIKTNDDLNLYNTGSEYKRYTFRTNVDIDLSNSVNAYLNVFTRIQTQNQPGSTTAGIFQSFLSTPNNAYPVLNSNGSLGGNQDYTNNIYGQTVYSGYRPTYFRDFRIDLGIKGKLDAITPGLWVKGRAAINAYLMESITRTKNLAIFQESTNGLGEQVFQQYNLGTAIGNSINIDAQNKRFYTEFSLGYNKKMGEHELEAILLASDDNVMDNSQLPSDLQGISGRLAYNFSEKYMFEVAFAYNGSQLYPKNNRYGFFPAVGLGWNISSEDFLKGKVSWLDNLKLRASYGKTGNNNVGYYEYNKYYNSGTGYSFGETHSPVGGVTEGDLINPYISWEKALKFNVGIDAAFFKNTLSLTADFYTNKFYDLLQIKGSSTEIIGEGYPRVNIGEQRNAGFEFQLSYRNKVGAFNYFISPNLSINKSKSLFQDEVARKYSWMQRTGQPVGQAFGYIADGLFQNTQQINSSAVPVGMAPVPGDIKYRDLNNDNTIDENDITAIGGTKPQVFYGINLGASIKGFDLSALFQGVANRMLYLSGNSYWEFQNGGKGQAYEHNLDRWTPATASTATYPRVTVGQNVNNQQFSSYWFKPADYLRLKSVELGYTLPISLVKRVKLSGVRFFVNGYNLFTTTSLEDGMDPEGYTGDYPVQRVVTAGINIKL